jgi:hypothetical protein
MNEGVKVLIERMKTNPEDFEVVLDEKYKHGMKEGRFYWVSEQIRDYLRIGNNHLHLTLLMKEDLNALVEAFKEKHQQEFTDKVMKDLFKEEETPSPAIAGGWMSNGTTISPLQNTLGTWTDPRLAMQSQINATSGLTNVSFGSTGTTATTLSLGDETLDSSILKKLKALIK